MTKGKGHNGRLETTNEEALPSVIKFNIPDTVRDFLYFTSLPKEIRNLVWESFLMTPGIQFVKLQSADASWDWATSSDPLLVVHGDDSNGIEQALSNDSKPRSSHQAYLVPTAPCLKSDFSQYRALRRDLKTLENTCHESREVAKFLCKRRGALKSADGKMVSLGKSPDVIFLEYLPQRLYQTNCGLTSAPLCSGLENLQRIAVRFSHIWREQKSPCSDCGDTFEPDPGCYPTHLYQFLARHLPNLQEVFFIDYYIVRRTDDSAADRDSAHPGTVKPLERNSCRFQAGNRLFHEVNEADWIVDKKVFRILDWLRNSYVHYATSSKLCDHREPKTVRFAVLGCQWQISAPVQRHSLKRKCHESRNTKRRQIRGMAAPSCGRDAEAKFSLGHLNVQPRPALHFKLGKNNIRAIRS